MTALRKRRSPSTASSQPSHIKRAKKITQFHHYQPLEYLQQQIRLVELLPGKPGSRISIKLHTVSLNDDPEYEALSYCWGPPKPSYDIFIHANNNNENNNTDQPVPSSFSFSVGRNLRKALDDLRLQDRPRLIWNDAICINQGDNVEKGYQIQLMHQIYSRASVVCAWLDHNVQPKTSVFDDLENLGKGVELDDFHDPSYWYPVADIFRNEYWRRLWIQQELILAAKVDLYCRRDVFSGEQLLEFQQKVNVVKSQRTRLGGPEFVLSRYIDGNTSADPTPEIFGGGVIQARLNMREGQEAQEAYSLSLLSSSSSSSPPSPPSGSTSPSPTQGFKITRGLLASSLLNLFLQSSSVRMTDPRDRLYGILGLATDIAQGSSLEINYEASPVWVYAQVFRHFIHRYKSLSFLCFNKSNPRGSYTPRKGFPSWMPHADVCWSYVNASRACGDVLATPHIVSIDLETLCLHAQGIKVDAIKHIGLVNGDGRGWTPIPEWLDQMESFCRKTWPDADDSTPLYERDNVTSLMFPCLSPKRYKNMWKLAKPDPPRRVHLIRSLLAAAQRADQKDLSTGDIIRGGYTPTDIIPADVREECHPLHVETNAAMLFGTEGSRVGSMARTSDIRAGDELWILFGCRMPIMMRPKKEEGKMLRYQVIGPAIVPGIMKGEAIKDAEDRGTTVILE